MPWYLYKRAGWEIAVDAVNVQDAAKTIKIQAPGAQYVGEFTPPGLDHPSMATAIVTPRRQEQISAKHRRENQEAGF